MPTAAQLLEELELTGADCSSSAARGFFDAWGGLLLVHRLRGGALGDASEALASRAVVLERPGSKSARLEIGTDECVFCSVGVAPYWEPPVVMVFGPVSEPAFMAGRWMTPWDSRGAARMGSSEGRTGAALVERYSLQSPDDGEYLPALLGHCFRDLTAFIDGKRPIAVDPSGVFRELVHSEPVGDYCWLHTPEARFSRDVAVNADTLRAVFVDVDALEHPEQKESATVLRRLVESNGGEFRAVQRDAGAVDYRTEVAAFMHEWLGTEGWV